MLPGIELMNCPNLAVPREVMHHVVHVESSFNPYAIGVVGGRLVRQPRSLPEALSTVRMLEQRGYNFSLGLAQVNRYNLVKYGLDTYEEAFQPCANLQAGSRILRECYGRSGGDWGKSFSCYYSGDFKTGYRHGYVQKVYASMRRGNDAITAGIKPIAVVDRAQRRVAAARARSLVERPEAALIASLAERRGGATPAMQAPVAGARPGSSPYSASNLPMQSVPSQAMPAIGAADAGVSAQSGSAVIRATQPVADAPVLVTATRLGAPPAAQSAPEQGGADGAFVF